MSDIDETQLDTQSPDDPDYYVPPAPSYSDLPANLLQHFDIKRKLGSGGAGSVYLAYDYRLCREVAVKVLNPGRSMMNQRLLGEARAQAKIEHPNICKIYQVAEQHETEHQSYLVMQYISGKPALDWIKEQSQVNNEQVVRLMQHVCDGLQAMHKEGIIHRDIKPANIMLSLNEDEHIHPYMVDFGLADEQEQLATSTRSDAKGHIAGTLAFMSPEQLQGTALDRRSDIYSFGVTLFQMLTCELPFCGQQPKQLTANINNGRLSADNTNWQGLPRDLKAIISKCLAADANKRYQSAKQLNQELQRYLDGEPIAAIRSNGYWLSKKVLKHKWQSLLASFIVVALVGQLGWQRYQDQQNAAREKLIHQFGQTIEQAGTTTRLAYMLPKHNTEYLAAVLLNSQQQILSQSQQLGVLAQPFSLYAQGRIAQQSGNDEQAQIFLNEAWQSGYQRAESALALVKSLDRLYQNGLSRARSMRRGKLRTARMAQLKSLFVTPILIYLDFLKTAKHQQGDSLYIKALIDYYNQDFDAALAKLADAQQFARWQYQPLILTGNIYQEKYSQSVTDKAAADVQQKWIDAAEQAYDGALAIAPSDYRNYLNKYRLYRTIAHNREYGKGDPGAYWQQTLAMASAAYALDKQQLPSVQGVISSQYLQSVYLENEGLSSLAQLQQSRTMTEQALQKWPDHEGLNRLLAIILSRYLQVSDDSNLSDEQRLAMLNQVEDLYVNHLVNKPDVNSDLRYNHGLHLMRWGDYYLEKQPELAGQKYTQAINTFEDFSTILPQVSGSYVNQALIQLKLVALDAQKNDKINRLGLITALLEQALAKGHSEFVANYYLARAWLQQAKTIGKDDLSLASQNLSQALGAIATADKVRPNNYHVHNLRLMILLQKSIIDWYLGKPAAPLHQQIHDARLALLAQYPDSPYNEDNAIIEWATLGEFALRGGGKATDWLSVLEQWSTQLKPRIGNDSNRLLIYLQSRLVLLMGRSAVDDTAYTHLQPQVLALASLSQTAESQWVVGAFYLQWAQQGILSKPLLTKAIEYLTVAINKDANQMQYLDSLLRALLAQYRLEYKLAPRQAIQSIDQMTPLLSGLKNNLALFNFYTQLTQKIKTQGQDPQGLYQFVNMLDGTTAYQRNFVAPIIEMLSDN